MNFLSTTDEDADETFERVYGPATYAFQYGGAHFVVLDNVLWNGYDGRNEDGKPKTANYRGGLRDDQLEFIENYVETIPRDDLVVLAMHIPANGHGRHHIPRWSRVLEILSDHPNTLSLSGHMHTQTHSFFGSEEGYTPPNSAEHHHHNVGTASGAWWRGTPDEEGIPHALMQDGTPNGYAILQVNGNEYTITYRAARRPADEQIRIVTPQVVDASPGEPVEILANVYNGCAKSRVRARIGDGEWIEMRHDPRNDPSVQELHEREKRLNDHITPMHPPRECAHIWSVMLPDDLPSGVHTIQVEEVDMFGRRHTASRMVTVE